jgi:outer membrane protein TolC
VICEKRISYAQSIANSYKAKYDKGETNILELHKSQINLLNVKKEAELNEIERNALLSELIRLNGNFPIMLSDSLFQTQEIPVDFEQWYFQVEQNNPVLNWLKQEIGISRKQQKLNSALALPRFYSGYMSEKVIGQHFQGISAGISIPLWENKNTRKQSKAQTVALQSIEEDNKLQFYNQLKIQHSKALGLKKLVIDYRTSLKTFDNSELLKKAFDMGEISLTDYILELTIYNNNMIVLLQSERDMNKAIANLYIHKE